MKNYYSKSVEETIIDLKTNKITGLTDYEYKLRIEKYGENKLKESKGKSKLKMVLEQFNDFLVIILIIAAIISIIFTGEFLDGIIIICIVILNIIISINHESKANNALNLLKEMTSPKTKVKRNNHIEKINSNELVPGDIVILDTGDYIPADLRLIESINLKIDESSLTGESISINKDSTKILDNNTELADRINCAYMGTVVTYGRGIGVVYSTGMETQIGNIATLLTNDEEEKTPLQEKLDDLAKKLGIACILICILIFFIGVLKGMDILNIFMMSVTLAVAAIPEGIAIVVTIILAIGVQRMVKYNVIVKRLSAVETLGSTNVICSDKTGTLTQNKMTIVKLYDLNNEYTVTGSGYSSKGNIYLKDNTDFISKNIYLIIEGAVLCNDSIYDFKEEKIIGDPTEGAMLVLGKKFSFDKNDLNKKYPRIREIPFDSERKLMSTYHKKDDHIIMYTKGAPFELLSRCNKVYIDGKYIDLTDEIKNKILKKDSQFASEALRVLGIAFRNFNSEDLICNEEKDLIFLGLICMIDPPREGVKEAISECKKAGITVKMITGDNKITASVIAKNLGIISKENESLEGKEIDECSDQKLCEKVKSINVFARVSPEHKVRLVKAIKDNGNIVAMTGDGVNDAPALKKADIGIAMGITGTDVSKEASDMILTDDNFISIVKAVEQGRIIYSNIIKVNSYLLSSNIAEIFIILIMVLFDFPGSLVATQLLFINLLTDAFPAFAIAMEKKEDGIMDRKPRSKDSSIMEGKLKFLVLFRSIFITISVIGSFIFSYNMYTVNDAVTICFSTLVISELFMSYSLRTEKYIGLKKELFENKYLNKCIFISIFIFILTLYIPILNIIFSTVPLNIEKIIMSLAFSLISIVGSELCKIFVDN